MSELPFELVIEILSRVPLKDLVRFSCVCKSWKSLFEDKSFIRKHTTHAPTMNLLLVGSPSRQAGPPSICCTYEGGRLEMIFKEPELNNGGDKIKYHINSVNGPCHGLFCLELVDKSFAVWNPILRKLRKISTIKPPRAPIRCLGFGYDHSMQDHKIVLIPHFLTNSSKAQVLALKSSVSRMIDFPWNKVCHSIGRKKEGILVGENIFWLLYFYEDDIELSGDILTFNVMSERFNCCSSPGLIHGTQEHRDLIVLRGSLCTVERDTREHCYCPDMVVWRADHEKEDKGRIKSWSKILKLTKFDIERETCWKVGWLGLGTVLNEAGSLLVKVVTWEEETKLCENNLEEGTIRKVEASLPIHYLGKMKEYIATLVPA